METSPHIDLIHQGTLGENVDKPIKRSICPIKWISNRKVQPPPEEAPPTAVTPPGRPADLPRPDPPGEGDEPPARRRSAFLDGFTAVGALISGLATAGALIFAGGSAQTASDAVNVTREQLLQAKDNQTIEWFTKAVSQLSSRALPVRLSGVYTLERVATDSERDQPVVIETLCAFVRVATEKRGPRRSGRSPGRLGLDTQAALTVIGRRVIRRQPEVVDLREARLAGADLAYARLANASLGGADLSSSRLKGALLTGADLSGATLVGADLNVAELGGAVLAKADLTDAVLIGAKMADSHFGRATLVRTKLQGAVLVNARFSRADFTGADLGGARMTDASAPGGKFIGADLSGATLRNADLSEADFAGARLMQADLSSADLTDAGNLTLDQLRSAKRITAETKLPPGLTWIPGKGVQKK